MVFNQRPIFFHLSCAGDGFVSKDFLDTIFFALEIAEFNFFLQRDAIEIPKDDFDFIIVISK